MLTFCFASCNSDHSVNNDHPVKKQDYFICIDIRPFAGMPKADIVHVANELGHIYPDVMIMETIQLQFEKAFINTFPNLSASRLVFEF